MLIYLWSTLAFVLTPYIICDQTTLTFGSTHGNYSWLGIMTVIHKILVFGLSTCVSVQCMQCALGHGPARWPRAQGHAEYPGYLIMCSLKSIPLFSVGAQPIITGGNPGAVFRAFKSSRNGLVLVVPFLNVQPCSCVQMCMQAPIVFACSDI